MSIIVLLALVVVAAASIEKRTLFKIRKCRLYIGKTSLETLVTFSFFLHLLVDVCVCVRACESAYLFTCVWLGGDGVFL